MRAHFFASQSEFRKWLENNHQKEKELLVGYYKINSGKPSMTWSQSVDQALCFGWIDGVRKSINEESYSIRFTPRKKNSIWSAINIRKMQELIQSGWMTEFGLQAFSHRKEEKSKVYSYEIGHLELPEDYLQIFKENAAAWAYFEKQPTGYKKNTYKWILTAQLEKTKLSRLEKAIHYSAQQLRLK